MKNEKKKVGLYPGWGTTTHDSLHLMILNGLKIGALPYSHISKYVHTSLLYKIKVKVYTICFLIYWMVNRSRYTLKYRRIIISHSIIESCLRSSKDGKFRFLTSRTFYFLQGALQFIDALFKFEKSHEIKIVLGGDEAYLKASILGQYAVHNKIPTLFFKQKGNHLSVFPYNINTLYAGPPLDKIKEISQTFKHDFEKEKTRLEQITQNKLRYSYMRKQNSVSEDYTPNYMGEINNCVVLFLHDFIDSPGIYGKSVFFDQWEWIKSTLKVIRRYHKKLIIKFHPNAFKSNEYAINKLIKTYQNTPEIFFEKEPVPIVFYKKNNALGVLTMFGSVIWESAFVGLPCISCSNNPSISFNLSNNAKTKSEFKSLLKKMCLREIVTMEGSYQESIICYSANKALFPNYNFIANIPYDDIDKELFQSLFHKSEQDVEKSGIEERRSAFLYSPVMKEYMINLLEEKRNEIYRRINDYYGIEI